jgi:hypothetical protein
MEVVFSSAALSADRHHLTGENKRRTIVIKPIKGTWFEFQHHSTAEGKYWDPACAAFSGQQWDAKIKEMAELGMEYLVLMCVACFEKAYFKTSLLPRHELGCVDPIETMLAAGDRYGLKIFMSNGYFGKQVHQVNDPVSTHNSLRVMTELAGQYGHHKSFYGWYFPNEAGIDPYFKDEYINYAIACHDEAKRLMPDCKTLIAPFHTNRLKADDTFVRQLAEMSVDIIAYQDEVGVGRGTTTTTAACYEALRKAHDRVPQVALWADVEVFDFEGPVYKSALLPAQFSRIKKQLAAVSPYVDTVLIYQYQGMLNKPGTAAMAGHPDSTVLYTDYANWLKTAHPGILKKIE